MRRWRAHGYESRRPTPPHLHPLPRVGGEEVFIVVPLASSGGEGAGEEGLSKQ